MKLLEKTKGGSYLPSYEKRKCVLDDKARVDLAEKTKCKDLKSKKRLRGRNEERICDILLFFF